MKTLLHHSVTDCDEASRQSLCFIFFPVVSVPHYYSRGRVLSNPLLGGDGFITYHSALKSEAPILGDQVFSLQFIQFCFVAGQYDMSEL